MSRDTLRVLIVEDDEEILEAITSYLRRRRFDVVTALTFNGGRAALTANGDPPDVLLTDVRLPDGNGLELVRDVARSEPPRPRVIVMSGHLDSDSVRDAKANGAEAVLAKPFQLSALLAQIGAPTGMPVASTVQARTLAG